MTDKKNLGGRPTKYSDEIIKQAKEYMDFDLFETVSKEIVVKDQIQTINYERPSKMPSIAGLARHLKINRDTLYEWKKNHPQFSDILQRLQLMQEEFLEYHGLTRGYDSGFAKFISQNVTRYRDKIETTNENKNIEINIDADDSKL